MPVIASRIVVKFLRLGLVALATATACFGSYFITNRDPAYWLYRCVRQAKTTVSCFSGDNFDFTADLFGMRYEGNSGNYIDQRIFYVGAYEKPMLFLLRDIMRAAFDNQGVFIDVGANTGQHSLFMSRYSKEVHAFEPYEPVLKRFRKMVDINQIRNIVIHPVGLGHEAAKLPFYKPPDMNLATGSFVAGFKPDNTYGGELDIQVGDEALATANVGAVALIKIDIEGYEKHALTGLSRTLREFRPVVIFELTSNPTSPDSIKSKRELVALFPDNYEFLVVDKERGMITGEYWFIDFDGQVHFDRLAQNDVLAYPVEKKNTLGLSVIRTTHKSVNHISQCLGSELYA